MSKQSSQSPPTTQASEMVKLRRDKFALLAKVGQRKREASQFQDEAEYYFGIVTALLAVSGEAMAELRLTNPPENGNEKVADLSSRHIQLTRQLLSYWPKNLESQERVLRLLNSDGLAMTTTTTDDGYVIPSSDLILESVARAIAATSKESSPKQ